MLYRENQLFVPERKKYGEEDYFGIVGHSGGKMVCYMCPSFLSGKKCHHIQLIEKEENQDHPAVSRFRALSNPFMVSGTEAELQYFIIGCRLSENAYS